MTWTLSLNVTRPTLSLVGTCPRKSCIAVWRPESALADADALLVDVVGLHRARDVDEEDDVVVRSGVVSWIRGRASAAADVASARAMRINRQTSPPAGRAPCDEPDDEVDVRERDGVARPPAPNDDREEEEQRNDDEDHRYYGELKLKWRPKLRTLGSHIAPIWMWIRYGIELAVVIAARTVFPTSWVTIFTAPGSGRRGGPTCRTQPRSSFRPASRFRQLVLAGRAFPGASISFVARDEAARRCASFAGFAVARRAETVDRLLACVRLMQPTMGWNEPACRCP